MKNSFLKGTATVAILLAGTAMASAQVAATATADLNVRAGPGPQHPVVGVIGINEQATVEGCMEGSKWCSVSHNGVQGWAYSEYLTGTIGEQQGVYLSERPAEAVPTVTYETTASTEADAGGAVAGAATGVLAGALLGGPAGAAVGAAAGAVAGGAVDTVTPPREVLTYVERNRIEPIYLEGEVVVGAGIPEPVEIREIPDYEYRYVYVNGQPVLVEPKSRRIVYVIR